MSKDKKQLIRFSKEELDINGNPIDPKKKVYWKYK